MAAALIEVVARQDIVQDDQAPHVFHGPAGEKCRKPYQATRGCPGLLKLLELRQVIPGGVSIAVKGEIHDDPPRVALSRNTSQGQSAYTPKSHFTGALRS